jgi:DNA polymerase I-like protein with 3'-5' exonuclease and polymerase domains
MVSSLWGEEFIVEETPKKAQKIKEKIDNPTKPRVRKTAQKKEKTVVDVEFELKAIYDEVYRILGKYKDNTVTIKTREELTQYIDAAISNGVIAIDTETNNSLQPITCKLMGPCIYTPGQKNAYIPLNHVDFKTGQRLEWQLTEIDIKEEFDRLTNTLIIMHNAKFDYKVIKCTCGKQLHVYWDTMLGAQLLNENELAGLKFQYIDKIDPSIEKYDINHLFKNVEYAIVDPEVFALYAATDAYMTYMLYLWQKEQFEKEEHKKLYKLFLEVEMPVMEVAAEMELQGVCIDDEFAERLGQKYRNKLDVLEKEIETELDKYTDTIRQWRMTDEATFKPLNAKPNKNGEFTYKKSKSEQLETPINLGSPTQLSILIYDVLQHPVVDQKSPRGTGEEILEKINLPICKLILERRGLLKLKDTYIEKLPLCVLPETGKVHANFNQLGTEEKNVKTGRFSSTDPNLQNIPSKEKAIRMLFKASPGHILVGSDFSQQEPRLLSNYSQDKNMINAYKEGKDLYATIASGVYHNDYWDNMEHHQDGSANPAGKKRRSACKSLLLGIMYGRGVASIAEQIGGTTKEAQKIVDDFYKSFPKVKDWVDATEKFAKENGYVEDLWGRRRRLPDIQLQPFEVRFKSKELNVTFNPLLGSKGKVSNNTSPLINKYLTMLGKAKGKDEVNKIIQQAATEGLSVRNNGGFISQAERQCVNARVQGGAATMSKKAMIKVYNDKELNELGFHLMLAVHDELIGECPEENAQRVADRLCDVMKSAALPECKVPFKCDPTIERVWYYTDYSDGIRETFNNMVESGKTEQEALNVLVTEKCECTKEQLIDMLNS